MGSGEKISYQELDRQDLAGFFREIADKLEGREDNGQISFSFDDFRKLKVGIKKDADGFSMKIKMKSYSSSESEKQLGEQAEKTKKNRYKEIKKRMKKSFKGMNESLIMDILPSESLATSFLQDSKLMISYNEYGAEHYPEYDKICSDFRKAFENKDTEGCKSAYLELNRLKKECHKRHK
ncbi:MAG: GAK system XXXCH domain-containing protein [Desulfococcaceae bacterium]|nr:GAK system XXXCH domain-containing protein [Desulfococcaceae bacterium]